MNIERLRLANNGIVEVHSEGPMCWHDDYAELQRQLAEREKEIADLIHPHDLAKYRSAKCVHEWGHNAGYDVCLKCGHLEDNDDTI